MYPPYPLVKRISAASNLPIRISYHAKRTKFSGGVMKPRPKTKKIKRLELAKKILNRFYKVSLKIKYCFDMPKSNLYVISIIS